MQIQSIKETCKIVLKMEVNKALQFKSNTFFEVVTSICYLFINIFFWSVMFNLGYTLPGWNQKDILVFIAFSELFFGLHASLTVSLSRFWLFVISGKLDTMLVRPIDPRLRIILLNINYIELIKTLIFFIFLLLYSGHELSLIKIILGVLVCFCGLYVFALIQLIISYFSFSFGKVEALNELSDSLTVINKYPVTIFPKIIFVASRIIFPFLFFSTFPAQIVNGILTKNYVIWGVIGLVSNLAIWTIIHNICWKKGLVKYESYNG